MSLIFVGDRDSLCWLDSNSGSNLKSAVDEIRASGYEGPLSVAVWDGPSQCYVVSLIAYKNLSSHLIDESPPRYVISRPVSRLLQFFATTLRVRFKISFQFNATHHWLT